MPRRRVAVVGMLNAGKTSLITSLISHLKNHNPSKLDLELDPKNEPLNFEWHRDKSGERQYEQTLSQLRNGKWPDKSSTPSEYRFTVDHRSFYFARDLTISDIPGERLSDLDIMINGNVFDWGIQIVNKLSRIPSIEPEFKAFRDLYHCKKVVNTDEESYFEKLKMAYRDCLTQMVLKKRFPLITPSSFFIDADGNAIPKGLDESGKIDWCKNDAILGLANEKTVIPLPQTLRDTKIGKELQQNFLQYKKEVVEPSLNSLIYAHDVIVLIDVARILEEGPLWLDTICELLQSLSKLLDPGNWFNRNIKWAWQTVMERIMPAEQQSRIHLLASQIDRVHYDDRNNVKGLLKFIHDNSFSGFLLHSGKIEMDNIASIKSLDSSTAKHELYFSDDGKQINKVFEGLSCVPSEFPTNWKSKEYKFADPKHPFLPTAGSLVPDHINLNKIVNAILEW